MASKRATRRRACTGKVQHDSAEDARASIPPWFRGLHPYKCSFCGKWHLGHMPHRVKQSIAERKER